MVRAVPPAQLQTGDNGSPTIRVGHTNRNWEEAIGYTTSPLEDTVPSRAGVTLGGTLFPRSSTTISGGGLWTFGSAAAQA